MPPDALSVCEYAAPSVATARDEVVMLNGEDVEPAVTVTDAVPDAAESATLVAVTVSLVFAVTVGA